MTDSVRDELAEAAFWELNRQEKTLSGLEFGKRLWIDGFNSRDSEVSLLKQQLEVAVGGLQDANNFSQCAVTRERVKEILQEIEKLKGVE
jgi:hypothetical protein